MAHQWTDDDIEATDERIKGYLQTIKNASSGESVRDAIIKCMNTINADSKIDLIPKVISGKLSEIQTAPYTPPEGKAFSQVTLRITDDTGETKNENEMILDAIEINNDIDPHAVIEPEIENYYWNKIVMNLDVYYPSDIGDVCEITKDMLDNEGGYRFIDSGYNAVKKVIFKDVDMSHGGSGGKVGPGGVTYFTVTFYGEDGTTVLDTQQVPMHGTAVYSKATPTKAGMVFTGWNPPPTNIIRETSCYAQFGDISVLVNEIEDSWETIAKNRGSKYNIGEFKTLQLHGDISYDKERSVGVVFNNPYEGLHTYENVGVAMKVANAEPGSTSTWLLFMTNSMPPSNTGPYSSGSFPNSNLYQEAVSTKWLNEVMLPYTFPESLSRAVVPVAKNVCTCKSIDGSRYLYYEPFSTSIWQPSIKEMVVDGDTIMTDASKEDLKRIYIDKDFKSLRYMNNLGIATIEQRQQLIGTVEIIPGTFDSNSHLSGRDGNDDWHASYYSEYLTWDGGVSNSSSRTWRGQIFGFCL